MKRQKVLILLMSLFVATTCFAQEVIFRNFSSQQYQGGTQNWGIEQLPDGCVAIANNNGLLFFDGARWELYPISNYSTVRSLRYDQRQCRMYAGASNEFGYYAVDANTYQYVYHSLSAQLSDADRNFGEIWSILYWKDKVIFMSKSHLFILGAGDKITAIRASSRIETMQVNRGRLIVATHQGLCQLLGNRLVPLSGATFRNDLVVRALCNYQNRLIIATQQNGLLSYDGTKLEPFLPELTPVLSDKQTFSMAIYQNKIAIGTVRSGLIVKNLATGTIQYLNTSQGLQNNTILSVNFDKRGNIWMGLDNGVSYALLNAPFSNIVSERYSIGTGYNSIAYGPWLYLGTNQGLYTCPMPFGQQLESRDPLPVSGIGGQVWCLKRLGSNLFCGTDRGLYQVQGQQASPVPGLDGTWTVCELKKHPGYAIATDYLGMALLKQEGNGYVLQNRIKIPVEVSGNLFEDTDGTLWMGNWQLGIYHLQLSADMKQANLLATYNKDNQLVVSEGNSLSKVGNTIYISSVDGFYVFDHVTKKLVYDKKMSRLFNVYGESMHIEETPSHDIWAQKGGFLAIAHRRGNGYVVDSMSYRPIVKNQQLGLANMTVLSDKYSIINSNNGFYLVNNHFVNRGKDYPLTIRRIISTNDGDSTVYRIIKRQAMDGRAEEVPHVQVAHTLNSLRIEYVMPEYQTDDAITYECYLENYDANWTVTSAPSKEYTHLGKGNYVFHVKAYNRLSGKTQEASIKITILPAWYETSFAYFIYFVLICFAFYGILRYLKFRADRELIATKKENERRMAIERAERKAEMVEVKNEQLQTELKHKSNELAGSTMNLIHHNDILQKLDESMQDLSEAVRREDKKAVVTGKISEIRNNLQTYLNDDDGWGKFEENFNLVYDDFMKKLTDQFTTLKISDRKLCAYLRMGLSSKEMASLLNMSVRSVETARYRLRKKLNLEAGDNLTDFIQNFGKEG